MRVIFPRAYYSMRITLCGELEIDGRICVAKLTGDNYPDTYMDQGGFDPVGEDPIEASWKDGSELTEKEWEMYEELIFEYLLNKGVPESGDTDYEDIDF